jgi:hypothetical protein
MRSATAGLFWVYSVVNTLPVETLGRPDLLASRTGIHGLAHLDPAISVSQNLGKNI